jgi:GNAT superfamily N-acetyltransferase
VVEVLAARARELPVSLRLRDVRVFRPYPDEVPWDLLTASAGSADEVAQEALEASLTAVLELNLVRVAKHEGRLVGAYAIRPLSATRFELVALTVAEGFRRQGLGRWLLGHALGLAESRGAREVLAHGQAHRRFLARSGFQAHGPDLLLTLSPE